MLKNYLSDRQLQLNLWLYVKLFLVCQSNVSLKYIWRWRASTVSLAEPACLSESTLWWCQCSTLRRFLWTTCAPRSWRRSSKKWSPPSIWTQTQCTTSTLAAALSSEDPWYVSWLCSPQTEIKPRLRFGSNSYWPFLIIEVTIKAPMYNFIYQFAQKLSAC